MGLNDKITGTIQGSPIVETVIGKYTGDRQVITADGRVWNELKSGVPTTMATGSIISTVQK